MTNTQIITFTQPMPTTVDETLDAIRNYAFLRFAFHQTPSPVFMLKLTDGLLNRHVRAERNIPEENDTWERLSAVMDEIYDDQWLRCHDDDPSNLAIFFNQQTETIRMEDVFVDIDGIPSMRFICIVESIVSKDHVTKAIDKLIARMPAPMAIERT